MDDGALTGAKEKALTHEIESGAANCADYDDGANSAGADYYTLLHGAADFDDDMDDGADGFALSIELAAAYRRGYDGALADAANALGLDADFMRAKARTARRAEKDIS